jgi:hypothetical protein
MVFSTRPREAGNHPRHRRWRAAQCAVHGAQRRLRIPIAPWPKAFRPPSRMLGVEPSI